MPLSRGPRALEPRGAVDPFPLEIAQARGSIVTPAQRVLETPQEAGRGRGSAIQLALAAAQTAAKAVSSSPPAACALTADLDKLIDRVFLPLFKRRASVSARGRRLEKRQLRAENFCAGAGAATRPGGGVPGEASAHEGGEERQERDKKRQRQNCVHDGEMAASDGKGCGASSPDGSHVCYDSLVDTARGPTGEQPRRGSRSETELFVGLECLAAEAAELSDDSSDATDSDDGGDGTCMHGTPYRTVLADSAAEASDQASSNDEAVALLPRGIFRESRASCRRQAHAAARMRLSLFARHPVAWSLCLRALEQAAVVASSGLFPLRSESAEKSRASKLLLVSSLRRRIALFSTSSLSLAGADDVSEQTGAFLEVPDETELERRLLCRAFFAARLLLLLADAGLPFLQLPLSPPQLSRPTPGRSACAPSSPSSGAESAKGVHGRGDDDFLQIAPSLCYGGEMPFLLCPEDAHAPPSPWSHAGESAFRVSPFVSLRLSPPPLAAPQLLHRELSSLLHCCCLFTSLSLSRDASDDPAPPLRREGEAARLPDKETFHRGHEARGNGTGVGERQGGTAAPPHTGCALWRAEISETLSEAAASLVVHTVAQQQLEGGTSVPLLQQKTGLQRAVSLVRLFCFSSSESEPFPASVGRPCPSSSECPRGAASRGKGTCVAGVAPWLVFARVCVGLVRALVGLAEGSPSSAGRDHLSSSAHRSLFQASFLRESPLLLLLLQEAVSLALSLLRSDSPTGRAPEHASAHLASTPATEPRHVSCSALEPSRCSRSPARELDAPASASLSTAEKEEGRRRRAMPVRHSREKRAPANVEVPSMVLPSQTCSLPGLRTEARVRLQPAVRRFCDELLVAALEAARRLLRFWSARLGEEAERRQRRQRAAGNANEERVKKVAEVKEIRPRSDSGSASPSPRTKREKDETQGDSPSRGAAASASHGRKKGRPANLEQTQPKREEASGGTLPEDDAKLTHDEGALITCAFEEGPLAGVAAAFGVGGGEVVRRFVESLLFVLEALPDAASSIEEESCASTSSPRSEVPPSSASSFEPLSSSAFLGTETKLHALSSEIVALLFSLPTSLFLLSPCLPPRHMQASPSFASSVSPFVSAAGEAAPGAASLAASYPLLSVWCASDMPVGGLFAAVDAAARAAPQSLPQLLSWFQLRVNDSLARVALALLPPLASPSAPQLAAFPKRVLHLLLHWTLPLSKQLVPSLLMSHLLPCCASGAGRGEQGDEPWSCARAGATALPPSPRRKREKRAKREGEGGTHEAKSWVQPEPCVETSALAKRLGLPLVGCLCTPEEAPRAEEAGARRPSGSHAAGDSVGESGAAGVGARVSRRRQATCRDETERDAKAKVEPDWKAREPVEKAGSAAGIDADERSALSASSFASSLVVVRLLARVLHSRCLSDDDTLAAVQSLSVIFSPFLALRAASPSANGAEKTSGLPDDCREGQQHCGKRGGSRDGGCHDKQNGEIAGREKWRSELYEKKILDALRYSLEHHGLLMELLDAIVYAATLWRPVAGVGRSEAGAEDASGGGSGEERRALSVSQEHADAVQDSWELRLERRDACACLLQQLVLLFGDSLLPGLNQLLDRVTSPPSLDLASQTSTDARASSPWAAEAVCEGVLEATARARPGSRSRASSSASWLPSARPGDGGEGVESETAEEMAAAEASLWACCAARRAACLGDLQAPETCAGVHAAALRVLESYRKRRAETRCGSTWSPAAGDGDAKEGPRGLGGGTASRAPTVELPRLLREAAPHRGGERVVAEHLGRRFAGCELDGWRLLPAVGAAVCLAFSSDCFASRACPGSRHEATKKERPDDAARLGGGLVSAAVGVCGAADLALSLAQLAEDLAQCAASCRRAWRWPFSGLHGSPERRAAEARGLHAFGLCAFLWRELRVALLRVLVRLNANLLAAPLARRPAKGEVSPSPEAAKEAGTSPVREASSGCRGEALASGVKRARDADEGTEPRGTCGDATVSLLRDLQLHLQRALWLLLRGELPSGADLIEGATGRRRGGSTLASASPVFRFLPSEAGLEDEQLAAVLSASLCLLARRLGEAGQIGDASRRDGLSPVSAKASQSHKARSSTGSNSKEALARVALIAPWLSTRRVPGGEAPTPDAEGAPADDADVPSTDGLPALLASGHYRVLKTRDGAEGGQSDERELARRVSLHFAALRAWLLATQAGMPDRARREIEAKAPREDKKRRCAPNGFETKDAESKLSPLVCEGREQVPDVESLWTLQVEFLHSCLLHRENFFSALVSAASHSPPGACEAASPLGSEAAEALRSDGPTSQVPQPRRGQSPAPQPASPALLAAVCRSATLAFSSFSRALAPSSPLVHSGSCAATGRQSKARSEREGRRGKLRILRALLQLMTRACFFSRADSRESLALLGADAPPAKGSSSPPPKRLAEERDGSAKWPAAREPAAEGEEISSLNTPRCNALRSLDAARTAAVVTTGLLPLIQVVGTSSPGCACGAEERMLLLDTVCTLLWSLLDQVATRRLHPSACSCCSCERAAGKECRVSSARAAPEGAVHGLATMQVRVAGGRDVAGRLSESLPRRVEAVSKAAEVRHRLQRSWASASLFWLSISETVGDLFEAKAAV
ncbi:hypothetical protein BESB_059960 [Besnoitia besnoiti]|uniref:Uncharacterized protein n=1 Tax=Besnoitia besnoiti TaxID=94643 RepID=A0A2A9MB48_BESBE|nr:hypothetical protein BESB_059960 [Besnoitia besnoiti]PFH35109.1 hypothetical protein BESB_059960 [Besnoitia besnoiti]